MMTQEIKDEALEQLESEIKFGFENEDELFDSIRDVFYDEEDFDEKWLKEVIAQRYREHQLESLSWEQPTDFQRLAKAFDKLIQQKIVCIHKAGYTKQDGESDCEEAIEKLNSLGIKAIGYCYYHTQDLHRAIDPESKNLCLGFDSSPQNDIKAIEVANKIVAALKASNFEVSWTGVVDQRIEIKNILWQKVPDNENWGIARVIELLSNTKKDKKPFWKFW